MGGGDGVSQSRRWGLLGRDWIIGFEFVESKGGN